MKNLSSERVEVERVFSVCCDCNGPILQFKYDGSTIPFKRWNRCAACAAKLWNVFRGKVRIRSSEAA